MNPTAKAGDLIPAQAEDAAEESATPNRKRLRLTTARDIRREAAMVYIACRLHGMPSQHGARLIFMLDRIKSMVELADIEARLTELERHAQHR